MCSVCVAVVPAIFKFHLDKNPRALRKTQQVLAAGKAAALSTDYCSPRKPWASLVWVTVVCGGERIAVTMSVI